MTWLDNLQVRGTVIGGAGAGGAVITGATTPGARNPLSSPETVLTEPMVFDCMQGLIVPSFDGALALASPTFEVAQRPAQLGFRTFDQKQSR